MTPHDFIAQLLLEMKPGPEGQITQNAILRALHKAYQQGYQDGDTDRKIKELRLQSIPREILNV